MHGNRRSRRYLGPWRVRRRGWPLLPVVLLAGGLVALGALRALPASAQQPGRRRSGYTGWGWGSFTGRLRNARTRFTRLADIGERSARSTEAA